jgi:hypothetical protein
MKPSRRVWMVLLGGLLAFVVLACACPSLINLTNGGGTEPMPGLTGKWQDPETYDIMTIAWQGGNYVVTSVVYNDQQYNVTSQSWSGSSLTWSYYIPETGVTLSYETTSLSGDSLYTNWWNDAGNSGTETLGRVP